MRRAPLVAFCAVLAIAAIPLIAYLAKPREIISSTPSAYTGLTVPLDLPAKATACADQVTFDTDSGIARFGATAPADGPAPALRVMAKGGGYAAAATVPGGWTGARGLDVRLALPREPVLGTLCVTNTGAK